MGYAHHVSSALCLVDIATTSHWNLYQWLESKNTNIEGVAAIGGAWYRLATHVRHFCRRATPAHQTGGFATSVTTLSC